MAIYFLEDTVTHAIKVGYSSEPERRVTEHQTSSSSPLALLGAIPGNLQDERALHAIMDSRFPRITGEWFEGSDALYRYVRLVLASQHSLLGFFEQSRVIEPHLCFTTSLAVGFAISIYWGELFRPGVRRYQVMRWDDGPGRGHAFWSWYLWEMPQWYESPAKAAAIFVQAWLAWVERGGDPN
jgi:hypothetical protein